MLTEKDKDLIQDAIAQAELQTSGEIRVHIDKECEVDPVKRAIEVFEELKMSNVLAESLIDLCEYFI